MSHTKSGHDWGAAAEAGTIGEQVAREWSKRATCYIYLDTHIPWVAGALLQICFNTTEFFFFLVVNITKHYISTETLTLHWQSCWIQASMLVGSCSSSESTEATTRSSTNENLTPTLWQIRFEWPARTCMPYWKLATFLNLSHS